MFTPDVASIPAWRDFGLVFAEEATEWNATQSRFMNDNGVLIFPYTEPSNMHYCLAGVAHATWESVHGAVSNCSADPGCPNQCYAASVVNNAVVGADGRWVCVVIMTISAVIVTGWVFVLVSLGPGCHHTYDAPPMGRCSVRAVPDHHTKAT